MSSLNHTITLIPEIDTIPPRVLDWNKADEFPDAIVTEVSQEDFNDITLMATSDIEKYVSDILQETSISSQRAA